MLLSSSNLASIALCAFALLAKLSSAAPQIQIPGLPAYNPSTPPWKSGDKCIEYPLMDHTGYTTFVVVPFVANQSQDNQDVSKLTHFRDQGRSIIFKKFTNPEYDDYLEITDEYIPSRPMDLSEMYILLTYKDPWDEGNQVTKKTFYMPRRTQISQKKCKVYFPHPLYAFPRLIDW